MKISRRSAFTAFNFAVMAGALGYHFFLKPEAYREDCAKVQDSVTLVQKMPEAAQDLAAFSALPIAGAPIRALQAEESHLRLCRVNTLGGEAAGAYSPFDKTMRMLEDQSNPYVLAHELFHGHQDKSGALSAIANPMLTMEDQLVANLVIEATAVGYSHMAFKELDARYPGTYAAFAASHYSFNMAAAFSQGYAEAHSRGADEKEALRAGGTAVVDSLLNGGDEEWSLGYLVKAARNFLSTRAPGALPSRRADADYQEKVADYFNKAAMVSDGVSILPASLQGAKPAAVDKILAPLNLKTPSS